VADEIIVTNQGRVEQAGTPTELYARPATPFVARFIGNSVPVNNYGSFRYFEDAGENSTGIVRPEFISIFKKGESVQFAKSAEEGVVEDIIFRGSSLEVRVRIHGNVLSALRSFNDPEIRIGETVDVFLHRMFIIREDQVHLAFNQSLRTESVFL
jgi:sulfate transport system ATP-binding protein